MTARWTVLDRPAHFSWFKFLFFFFSRPLDGVSLLCLVAGAFCLVSIPCLYHNLYHHLYSIRNPPSSAHSDCILLRLNYIAYPNILRITPA